MAESRRRSAGLVVRIVLILALVAAVYFVWQWREAGPIAKLEVLRVRSDQDPGDTRERVREGMGPPLRETETFPLDDRPAMAEAAAKTGATRWLLWEGGLGVRCVVGLDASGHVVYKGHTGT